MSTPPTLNYAPPPLPPRGVTPAFILLIVLATLYVCAIVLSCREIATDPSSCLFISIATVSTAIFITAAIQIRRRSYQWALAAFATSLINIAAILSCFGFTIIVGQPNRRPEIIILGCSVYILPFVLLIVLAKVLFTLMRHLKQPP